jgi:hypothetical protein
MVTRRIAVVWLLSLALCEHVFSIPLFIPDRGYPSFHPRSGISLLSSPIRDIPLFILDPGYPFLSVIIRDRRALADSCDARGKARVSTTTGGSGEIAATCKARVSTTHAWVLI